MFGELSSIKRRFLLLFALPLLFAVFGAACTELITPESTSVPDSNPNIEATVRVAVAATLSAVAGGPPSASAVPGETPRPRLTDPAHVQATITALLATPAVPGLSTNSATPGAVVPTPWPTLAPTPTATLAPTPTPTLVAAQGNPLPPPVTQISEAPTPRPTVQPTPTVALVRDCQLAPDGTAVTAWIDGSQVSSSQVTNGDYSLFLSQPDGGAFSGKTVSFKIAEYDAEETAIWVQGGGDELHLTATINKDAQSFVPALSPDGQGRIGGLLAQLLPPHVFIGTASLCQVS